MKTKFSERDIRALKMCVVGVVLILAYVFAAGPWFDDWSMIRASLAGKRARFDSAVPRADVVSSAKQAGLISIVPTFEMPDVEEKQKPLFRDKFSEQLKKAGVSVKSVQFLPTTRQRQGGGYSKL